MVKRKNQFFMLIAVAVVGLVSFDIWSASSLKADLDYRSFFPDLMTFDPPEKNALVGVCASTDGNLAEPAPIDSELSIEQVDDITRVAVRRGGGFEDVVQPGDWVVIKPNIVAAPIPRLLDNIMVKGSATDLRVIKSVIEQLIEEGDARRITVAEGKPWRKVGEEGTSEDQTVDGWNVKWPHYGNLSYEEMIADLNAKTDIQIDYVDMDYYNTSPYTEDVPVPGGGISQESYTIPDIIRNCDKLIAVAVMKTHVMVKCTLTQKLYIGISPGEVYTKLNFSEDIYGAGMNHFGVPHSMDGNDTTDHTVSDLVSYHPPDFGIIECFWGMEGMGPVTGKSIKRNLVIAGKDPLAVDSVGAYTMGFNPMDLEYSHWNHKKGFGIMDLNYIDVVGPPLDDVAYDFEKGTRWGRGCRAWLVNGPYRGTNLDKNYLGVSEETLAPVEGDMNSENTWTAFSDYCDYMDLANFFKGPSFCTAYAFTRIMSDSEKDVALWFGSDDGIKIWLNGKEVFKDQTTGTFSYVEEKIPVHLNKGENRLLVKVQNAIRNYGFSMYVAEEDGDTPMGVSYTIDPQ